MCSGDVLDFHWGFLGSNLGRDTWYRGFSKSYHPNSGIVSRLRSVRLPPNACQLINHSRFDPIEPRCGAVNESTEISLNKPTYIRKEGEADMLQLRSLFTMKVRFQSQRTPFGICNAPSVTGAGVLLLAAALSIYHRRWDARQDWPASPSFP
jgi:hypothetical protein